MLPNKDMSACQDTRPLCLLWFFWFDPHAGHHPARVIMPIPNPAPNSQPTPHTPETMAERTQRAKTLGERQRLMVENMASMEARMAEMSAMVSKSDAIPGKPMGMTIDCSHVEKMHEHMVMMHQMLESMMVQQRLMMPIK
jgi:hypothetical protein